MAECKYCGGEIEFRREGHQVVPIRVTCRCNGGRGGSTEERSECAPTNCPECRAPVFFVRHNGGSVWLDELGPPWPQHVCMASRSTKTGEEMFADYDIPASAQNLIVLEYRDWRLRHDIRRPIHTYTQLAPASKRPVCLLLDEKVGTTPGLSRFWLFAENLMLIFGSGHQVIRCEARWFPCRFCGTPYPAGQLEAHEVKHK